MKGRQSTTVSPLSSLLTSPVLYTHNMSAERCTTLRQDQPCIERSTSAAQHTVVVLCQCPHRIYSGTVLRLSMSHHTPQTALINIKIIEKMVTLLHQHLCWSFRLLRPRSWHTVYSYVDYVPYFTVTVSALSKTCN